MALRKEESVELDGEDLRRMPIRALRRRRRHRVQERLRARLRGHRVETARLDLSIWPVGQLGQGQKPEGPSSEARSRRGLGKIIKTRAPEIPAIHSSRQPRSKH